MKCNYQARIKSLAETKQEQAGDIVKRIWELTVLLTLHREFGFGASRLRRFTDALFDVQTWFNERARATDAYDKKKREMTDIDTTLVMLVRELRAAGIDHREIFDDGCKILVTDENGKEFDIDVFLDHLERKERGEDE